MNRRGASGRVEAHIVAEKDNYKQFEFQTPLPLANAGPEWRFGHNGSTEIIAITTRGASGTEAHIALGGSPQEDFKRWKWQTPTAIVHPTSDKQWDVSVLPYGNVAAFNRSGQGGNVDLHVMGREDFYKTMRLAVTLNLQVSDDISQKLLIQQVGSEYRIFHVKTSGTQSGKTEVDVYSTPVTTATQGDEKQSYCVCVNSFENDISFPKLDPFCNPIACGWDCKSLVDQRRISGKNGVYGRCRTR